MASAKISISLDPELIQFIDEQGDSRSKVINDLLWERKRELFLKELAQAYTSQSEDPGFQEEFSDWEITVGDGIDAERTANV